MKLTKQLIAGAAMVAIGALATAQAGPAQMPAAGDGEYPQALLSEAGSTQSRADVASKAPAAVAAGEIARGELALVELRGQPFTSEKTRAQVHAETLEARRLGLLDQSGELGFPQVTPEQSEKIRAAGLRARDDVSIQAVR